MRTESVWEPAANTIHSLDLTVESIKTGTLRRPGAGGAAPSL